MSLSIVTVAYNDLAGLLKTFNSLSSQSDLDFEWIVVDGGSVDGTFDFLSDCKLVDKWVSEKDDGIYDAMLKGLDFSTKDYVLFLNSGDVISDCAGVKTLLTILRNDKCNYDLLFFAAKVLSGSGGYIRYPRLLCSVSYSVPAIQQSTIYKASTLRCVDWPKNFKICGDYYIVAQYFGADIDVYVSNYVLSEFSLGGVSTNRILTLAVEANSIQRDVLSLGVFFRLFSFVRRVVTGILVWIFNKVFGN